MAAVLIGPTTTKQQQQQQNKTNKTTKRTITQNYIQL
jgi:hypothetical protein